MSRDRHAHARSDLPAFIYSGFIKSLTWIKGWRWDSVTSLRKWACFSAVWSIIETFPFQRGPVLPPQQGQQGQKGSKHLVSWSWSHRINSPQLPDVKRLRSAGTPSHAAPAPPPAGSCFSLGQEDRTITYLWRCPEAQIIWIHSGTAEVQNRLWRLLMPLLASATGWRLTSYTRYTLTLPPCAFKVKVKPCAGATSPEVWLMFVRLAHIFLHTSIA